MLAYLLLFATKWKNTHWNRLSVLMTKTAEKKTAEKFHSHLRVTMNAEPNVINDDIWVILKKSWHINRITRTKNIRKIQKISQFDSFATVVLIICALCDSSEPFSFKYIRKCNICAYVWCASNRTNTCNIPFRQKDRNMNSSRMCS